MKRFLCILLAVSLLLSGCGFFGERIKDPVSFHYLCANYPDELCCVVVSEQREASGHVGNLPYLLALYLMGPVDEEMRSPIPAGVQILSSKDGDHIILELTGATDSFSDIDFSLACACLTLTSLEITGAEKVTVRCGEQVRTLDRSSLTLNDITDEHATTEDMQ